MELDQVDRSILKYLHENARISLSAVAQRLGVGLATVHRRVQRLRRSGVIRGFFTRLEANALGFPLAAFVRLRIGDRDGIEERLHELADLPEIEEIHLITGDYDVLLKVRARDPAHLRRLLGRVHATLGSRRASTEICLSSPVERCAPLYTATPPGASPQPGVGP
jgi:DNA-binding Lrp family transcriptional regulator